MKRRFIIAAAALMGIAWLCTGGVVMHSYWVNPFKSCQQDFRPYILAELECHPASYGVPFLFQYLGDRTPFGISLKYITHNVVENGNVVFDRATIQFPDGSQTDLTARFQARGLLRPEEHVYIDDAHVTQRKPGLRWETIIDDCVPVRTRFTLRIKGRMTAGNQTIESFEADLDFSPDYDTHVYSTWAWILRGSA